MQWGNISRQVTVHDFWQLYVYFWNITFYPSIQHNQTPEISVPIQTCGCDSATSTNNGTCIQITVPPMVTKSWIQNKTFIWNWNFEDYVPGYAAFILKPTGINMCKPLLKVHVPMGGARIEEPPYWHYHRILTPEAYTLHSYSGNLWNTVIVTPSRLTTAISDCLS